MRSHKAFTASLPTRLHGVKGTGLLVAFSKCSSSCTGNGGTKTWHCVLLQTTDLVGLSSHNLNERLLSPAK